MSSTSSTHPHRLRPILSVSNASFLQFSAYFWPKSRKISTNVANIGIFKKCNFKEILRETLEIGERWASALFSHVLFDFGFQTVQTCEFIFITSFSISVLFSQRRISVLFRSRRELSNADLLAKFGFDTAENEPSKLDS